MAAAQPPPTEAQMLSALERGQVQLPPLRLANVQRRASAGDKGLDAIARLRWGNKDYRIAIQCKASSFPKSVDEATRQARAAAQRLRGRTIPLVLVPFLSEEQLSRLEEQQVSGIDLCGNGLVIVPGELLVKRSGRPNRFVREGIIKNIYRGTSSMVGRTFLLDRQFESLADAQKAIIGRDGEVTLATISKVATGLEKDLVIDRRKDPRRRTQRLRLIQPEKLLERLAANFLPAQIGQRALGKLRMPLDSIATWSRDWQSTTGERLIRTGVDSVEKYAPMAREPVRRFYCTNLPVLLDALGSSFTVAERFAEIEFLETDDDTVYFDRRPGLVASPIQTYLELMAGDKRDRETAEQVRRLILNSSP